jgi:riboflavin biosynthesis pyrimidine reductase
MREVTPLVGEGPVDIATLYLDLLGRDPVEDRPLVALNMVTTADGRATLRGTADIGTRTDRALLRHLRALVDGVMVGAGTLRAHDFTPRATSREALDRRELAARRDQPLAIVVSREGTLDTEKKFFGLPQERIVVVSDRASSATRRALQQAGATVVAFGREDVDLAAFARWLRKERDVRVLLCEGGPHLAGALFAQRLLDEVFLTQAWRVTGEPNAPSWAESGALLEDVRLAPLETYDGDRERYMRFRVLYGGA